MPNPEDPGVLDIDRFLHEFSGETDRAAVILGAAKLDILLYQILQRVLVPDPSSTDELLDGDVPIGTFSSRIKLVYRLGLIDNDFARCLHLVRRIRNFFAHELSGASLDMGSHRDRVLELVAPLKAIADWNNLATGVQDYYFKSHTGAPREFRMAVAVISLRLQGILDRATPLGQANMTALVDASWRKPGVFTGPFVPPSTPDKQSK